MFRPVSASICADAASAAASTSANLLANPSFEDGLAGWTSPDGKWGTAESDSGYDPQDGSYFAWPLQASQENTCIYQDLSLIHI